MGVGRNARSFSFGYYNTIYSKRERCDEEYYTNITNSNLPSDWDIYNYNGTVLAYTMNSSFSGKLLLDFNDNIQIEDILLDLS